MATQYRKISEPWHIRYFAGDTVPVAVLEYERFHNQPEDEEDDMITLHDTTENKAWVAANGKARPISNVNDWIAKFNGPIRSHPSMRFVVGDLYEITT